MARGGLDADLGQVGIELQVETGWFAFNAAQQQMLHGVKADGCQFSPTLII